MATIKGEIPPELEEEFRKVIALKYGLKKGNISLALQIAIEEWILKQKRVLKTDKKQTELILKQIRSEFPNQFTAIDEKGIVIAHGNSLTELYQKLDLSIILRIIEPESSRLNTVYKKRQIGWDLKRKIQVK